MYQKYIYSLLRYFRKRRLKVNASSSNKSCDTNFEPRGTSSMNLFTKYRAPLKVEEGYLASIRTTCSDYYLYYRIVDLKCHFHTFSTYSTATGDQNVCSACICSSRHNAWYARTIPHLVCLQNSLLQRRETLQYEAILWLSAVFWSWRN